VLVIIPLGLILVIALADRSGGGLRTPWFVNLILFVVFFGIANAINRARQHRPSRQAAPPPVVAESQAVVEQKTAAVDPAAKGGYLAGHWEQDRLVVSQGEIAAIMKNPDAFDNVITGIERQQPGFFSIPGWWFLVLARKAAVAFKADGSQVWALRPADVTYDHIASVDGRSQAIAFDGTCIAAWKSASWEEFAAAEADRTKAQHRSKPAQKAARWDLLMWSLQTRKDPSSWLSFDLPYDSVNAALTQLSACPDTELKALAGFYGFRKIAKWVKASAPDCLPLIGNALSDAGLAHAKALLLVGMVMGTIILVPLLYILYLYFSHRYLTYDQAFIDQALGVICLVWLAVAAGLTIHAMNLRKSAKRILQEDGVSIDEKPR
jgi:hypothetical protein